MTKQDLIRSSVAEYLTFITATGESQVDALYADKELDENSVTRKFRVTAPDSKNYQTKHYNLSAIIAVGYKVNSERAVQFRKWATEIVQSFAMADWGNPPQPLPRHHRPRNSARHRQSHPRNHSLICPQRI